MTKILIPDQVKTKTLTPSEVRAYNNHRLSEPLPEECVMDLFITIMALAKALRAEFLRAEQYHSHLDEPCRRAPGCIGQDQIADNARARVAAWLEY